MGRNEEELYPRGVDPARYYMEEILPKKLPVDLQYIETRSFFKDVKYLFLGTWVTLTGAMSRQHLTDNLTQILMLIADTLGLPGLLHPGPSHPLRRICAGGSHPNLSGTSCP